MANWTDSATLIAALAAGKAYTDEKAQAQVENAVALGEAAASVPLNLLPTVLLGTITTTSGASQSLAGLVLTPFKVLRLVFLGVSVSSVGNLEVGGQVVVAGTGVSATYRGFVEIDLANGTFYSVLADAAASASGVAQARAGDVNTTTASVSISVGTSAGTLDAGSVLVYGVK